MYTLTDVLERPVSLNTVWVFTADAMHSFIRYHLLAAPTDNWLILEFVKLDVPGKLSVAVVPIGYWTYVAAWDGPTLELTFLRCPTGNREHVERNVATAVIELLGR